jgi:hypothetical protein
VIVVLEMGVREVEGTSFRNITAQVIYNMIEGV